MGTHKDWQQEYPSFLRKGFRADLTKTTFLLLVPEMLLLCYCYYYYYYYYYLIIMKNVLFKSGVVKICRDPPPDRFNKSAKSEFLNIFAGPYEAVQ
jgi:hypothetical protein